MNREQKFWSAVYSVIGETSRLVDIGVLSEEDYFKVMKALGLIVERFHEQQKEEEKDD